MFDETRIQSSDHLMKPKNKEETPLKAPDISKGSKYWHNLGVLSLLFAVPIGGVLGSFGGGLLFVLFGGEINGGGKSGPSSKAIYAVLVGFPTGTMALSCFWFWFWFRPKMPLSSILFGGSAGCFVGIFVALFVTNKLHGEVGYDSRDASKAIVILLCAGIAGATVGGVGFWLLQRFMFRPSLSEKP